LPSAYKLTTMKKITKGFLLSMVLTISFSCANFKLGDYLLTQADAAGAIRQMLEFGSQQNISGAFSKNKVLETLFPGDVAKVLNTLSTLGLTSEVDRFTNTLSSAAGNTATAAVPIFVNSINKINLRDAVSIVKNGGTAATDYLRQNTGDTLRKSVSPIMQNALNEYKLNEQFNKLIRPLKLVLGSKVNIDLPTIMSGLITDAIFNKIAEKEVEVRSLAAARTTPLLQKVFSRTWN